MIKQFGSPVGGALATLATRQVPIKLDAVPRLVLCTNSFFEQLLTWRRSSASWLKLRYNTELIRNLVKNTLIEKSTQYLVLQVGLGSRMAN